MLSDKELKKKYGKEYSLNPDKYYPTKFIKSQKFVRGKCEKCGKHFWNLNPERKVCGDTACTEGYGFINDSPAKVKLTYPEVWKSFSKTLQKKGYTPIKRYPVVARWRDDIPFVEASIDDFIPHVINGVVKPPANQLTVPQFCLRFNDISNVGITGAHYTGFIMIGQHRFEKPGNFDPDEYLEHLYAWFNQTLGIPAEEFIFHEDIWSGSGNFGPCVEIFSRGVELANQVYMQFKQTKSGFKDLNLKVLDMGMGHERISWFTNGTPQSYETTFPHVIKKLKKKTGITVDEKILEAFMPYSGFLNSDEVEDVEKVWKTISEKISVSVEKIKGTIIPLQAIYSIADHTRSLLIAISDGALPSNTGGGYNLRVIFRRSMDFLSKHGWNVDLAEVCEWHVKDLEKLFPKIGENIEEVKEIIGVEVKKYEKTKKRMKSIIKTIKGIVSTEKMVELYDSHGINPETLVKEGVQAKIPKRFFEMVAERHGKVKKKKEEKRFDVQGIPKTKKIYYDDYSKIEFKAKVLKTSGDKVILDKTGFYPTSGGQIHDKGFIAGREVVEVFDEEGVVIHVIKGKPLKKGEEVACKIDWERRKQLAQHHTAVHVINGASRKILGNHVWQAGADKNTQRARIDITHYENPSPEQLKKIEVLANQIIKKSIPVQSFFLDKDLAEKKYGFRVYQGGAIPGSKLRIIKIGNFDVEACGGTHVKNTRQVGEVKIVEVKRIQDGVIRLVLKAGEALEKRSKELKELADEITELLGCNYSKIPEKTGELFKAWKKKRKGKPFEFKKGKPGKGSATNIKENLDEAASFLKVRKEHLPSTIKRFLKDLKK
ncbi:MAG: alanine--tRNA ligase [Nanoarchaeota archaeon]|nr:alanine--tRNA ligase [Nanoarchaeota archaeon]